MKYLKNHQGMTLLEVIASLVLIGIILFAFFTLLLQSNKTTYKSNSITDSTYEAQREMEVFYNSASSACTFEDISSNYTLDTTQNIGYSTLGEIDKAYNFVPREEDGFEYNLTLQTFLDGSIYKKAIYVHLDVIENNNNSKATMENVFELGGSSCAP